MRFCIRPIDGAFELLAIMDIRARSISFTSGPHADDDHSDRPAAADRAGDLIVLATVGIYNPTTTMRTA